MLNCILGVSNIHVFTSSMWLPQYYVKLALTSLGLIHSWACPLALRWIGSKFHSAASALILQPSDPFKRKSLFRCLPVTHCFVSHTPPWRSASGMEI